MPRKKNTEGEQGVVPADHKARETIEDRGAVNKSLDQSEILDDQRNVADRREAENARRARVVDIGEERRRRSQKLPAHSTSEYGKPEPMDQERKLPGTGTEE